MSTYYNEHDPFAASWLRLLMAAGEIPDGEVDERSIVDVRPDDLRGFTHCHFFAGIGGWALAARLAGWPADRELWTGSCPCQPWSSAGKGAGADDPRDLWPAWFQLIKECCPDVVAGEQVASADGLGWLDRLHDDMEAEDYAIAADDLGGPIVGAYDIRQRLWFLADRGGGRWDARTRSISSRCAWTAELESLVDRAASVLADCDHERCNGQRLSVQPRQSRQADLETGRRGEALDVGHTCGARFQERSGLGGVQSAAIRASARQAVERGSAVGKLADTKKHDHAGHAGDAREATSASCGETRSTDGDAIGGPGASSELADAMSAGRAEGWTVSRDQSPAVSSDVECVADTEYTERRPISLDREYGCNGPDDRREEAHGVSGARGEVRGFWSDAEWIYCRDGKYRAVEPGAFPLAPGLPLSVGSMQPKLQRLAGVAGLDRASLRRAKSNRVGRLRGYGNAIKPQLGALILRAYLEAVA